MVIEKVHDAVRCRASVASHVTVDLPTGNISPLAGVHVTVTGGAPEFPVGWPYTATVGSPRRDVRVTGAGQETSTASGSGGGGGGCDGAFGPAQCTAAIAASVRSRIGVRAITRQTDKLIVWQEVAPRQS
jgi:hypothetical protein